MGVGRGAPAEPSSIICSLWGLELWLWVLFLLLCQEKQEVEEESCLQGGFGHKTGMVGRLPEGGGRKESREEGKKEQAYLLEERELDSSATRGVPLTLGWAAA